MQRRAGAFRGCRGTEREGESHRPFCGWGERMNALSIVGTWSLLSFELTDDTGEIFYPYGRAPVGYIMYNRDGFMSVVVMSGGRRSFAANDFGGIAGTLREKVAAFDTYLSYSGRYETIQDRVIHRIEASLFPNWVGTSLERVVALDHDRLQLSADPVAFEGRTRTLKITWRRVGIG